jgi:hypothetical protein
MVATAVRKRVRRPAKATKVADNYNLLEIVPSTAGYGNMNVVNQCDSVEESLAWVVKDCRSYLKFMVKQDGEEALAKARRWYTTKSAVVIRNEADVVGVVKFRIRKGELVALVFDMSECQAREILVKV